MDFFIEACFRMAIECFDGQTNERGCAACEPEFLSPPCHIVCPGKFCRLKTR
jgi:hypothetical protein